jgi:predicted DNA-binding protein
MAQRSSTKDVRLQVVLPFELKEKLRRVAAGRGQKISVLVRESIAQKVQEVEREIFEERMREAYLEMAEENLNAMVDFKYSDVENL